VVSDNKSLNSLLSDKHIRKSEVGENNNTEPNNTGVTLDVEKMQELFPNASPQIFKYINEYADDFGIDTEEEMYHFLSQTADECGDFTDFEENMSKGKQRIMDIYPEFFNPQSDKFGGKMEFYNNIDDYVNNPVALANLVYDDGKRTYVKIPSYRMLGNDSPGDGWKYRGRGIIQITGKENYERKLGNPLYKKGIVPDNQYFIRNPDKVLEDKYIVLSALAFFNKTIGDDFGNKSIEFMTLKVRGRKKLKDVSKDVTDRRTTYEKLQKNNIFN